MRERELVEILEYHLIESERAIVAGDFNSFGSPWINWALGWAFGFRAHEYMVNETNAMRRFATARKFDTPIKGVTFPGFGFELDHFLCRGLVIRSAAVVPKRFGSDHRPIIVDVGFPIGGHRGCGQ